MKTYLRNLLKITLALVLVAALFGAGISPAGHAAAACAPNVLIDLYAKSGTATLFGATTVPFWGYSTTALGDPSLPGPTLVVNQNDCVQVTLNNTLAETTGLQFRGQGMVPDLTGASAGGTKVYTFQASKPGTFLYEAGLIAGTQHQTAMGMYGTLVVQPAVPAYAYNSEAVVVLSEIDPALNSSGTPSTFDMRNYSPKYFLINGKAYPDTVSIAAAAGDTVLLRYVNAGLQAHAMSTLGIAQKVIATDGFDLGHPHMMVAETIATGQTLDVLVTLSAGAADGTKYALYDANMLLRNAKNSPLGGMLTFLTIAGTPPVGPDMTGPAVVAAGLSPNPTNGAMVVNVSATISDDTMGGNNVTQAEFYIDSTAGSPIAMTGAFTSSVESVSGSISTAILSGLASGNHSIHIRGRDSVGNWGAFLSLNLNLDKSGPATSGVTLSPNPNNGTVSVTLNATGNDTASGGSNVVAAEYTVDGGSPVAMTAFGSASPVRGFAATIPSGLGAGTHIIAVRTQDDFGNWGAVVNINLVIDTAGPTVNSVTASPNPNNGSLAFNTSIQAVRIMSNFSDTGGSKMAAAEGFIDVIGTTGTGFVFIAKDGTFNSITENGYSDIPLAVINLLTEGNHTIYVHGKDSSGNWGLMNSTTLVIDKTAPTFNGLSLSPNPTNGAANSLLSVLNSAGSPTGGEYWLGTTPPAPGGGTQFSGVSVNIPVPANGTYTLNVRLRDASKNWSGIQSTTWYVVPDAIFSDGFESGNTSAWSSQSAISTNRMNVLAGAALVGSYGLAARGNNTNYVQYNFTVPSADFDARFSFKPNSNTGTHDIFSAGTSGYAATLFRVRYRWNGGTPQVQIQVGTTNTNLTWTNISNVTANVIQVTWQSGGSFTLYVNGVLSQTLTAGAGSVSAFRLGVVSAGSSNIGEYFDAFASKRTLVPLLP